ncbi:hypothetical protein GUITHDRAFT_110183 [Guillardia theta CCMP2712]|uniref:C2 domain-containing protein n=1 Tax=Guillardia theta (strain CCMP2712) TaxID=905079 RepID=L1J6K2_GUITC|nr:hypothetical protein GUITHDRAFT_110183 [Guillardia theta CCMP2712]EKX43729.1 hypothetical protein GUITHDRAFT_110183 [Guillardia theta CCMP2712]|eukprot:XP_005830709.1 hypothetical protein GUITHDRAFT_110183 [Guillardia theta CCMP2712]
MFAKFRNEKILRKFSPEIKNWPWPNVLAPWSAKSSVVSMLDVQVMLWEIDSEEQVLFEKKMTEEARQEVERDLCNRDSFSHAHDTALLEQVYPSRLEIIEISARHLPKLDLYGKCDPYCRITFCSQTKITSIQKTTYCPDWDEVLTFKLPAFQEITPMKIELFDHDFDSGPDYVGQAILSKEDIQDVIGDFNPNKTWTTMKAFKLCSADHQPTIGADQLRSTLKILYISARSQPLSHLVL